MNYSRGNRCEICGERFREEKLLYKNKAVCRGCYASEADRDYLHNKVNLEFYERICNDRISARNGVYEYCRYCETYNECVGGMKRGRKVKGEELRTEQHRNSEFDYESNRMKHEMGTEWFNRNRKVLGK